MKVLVISDTHGRLSNLERVLDKVCPLDLILHLGDIEGDHEIIRSMAGCPVVAVKGNNDIFSKDPAEQVVELKAKYGRVPSLAVILVGENPASQSYVRGKIKACEVCGFSDYSAFYRLYRTQFGHAPREDAGTAQ